MNRQRIGSVLAILVVAAVLVVAVKTGSDFYADDPTAVDATASSSPSTSPTTAPTTPSATSTRPGGPLASQFGLPEMPIVVYLGDASTAGDGAKPKSGYATQVAQALRWKASIVPGGRGSGYLTRGNSFRDRAEDAKPREDVDLVVIAGGTADAASAPTDVAAALPDLLDAVRTTYEGAAVLVVGPFATTAEDADGNPAVVSDEGLPGIDAALSRACSQAGVPYLSAISGQWLTDDPGPFLTKDRSLNEAGHEEFAQRIEQAFG